jgi:hypothetical protein
VRNSGTMSLPPVGCMCLSPEKVHRMAMQMRRLLPLVAVLLALASAAGGR